MDTNAPLFSDIKQVETVGQIESGAFAEGIKVSFRTRSGVVGSVFVPRTEYNAQHVADLVTAAATTIEEVAALKG